MKSLQHKILELIRLNGNQIGESDFIMLENMLDIDESILQQNLESMVCNNIIVPVWIDPTTLNAVSEKDFQHYESGYSVIYPNLNFDTFL